MKKEEPELKEGIKTTKAANEKKWRAWLKKNHLRERSVFLIIYRKSSGIPSVYYPEAVDQALCFGWIDSVPKKRDSESYYLLFSKRNPKSNWSGVNKRKVERLLALGWIEKAGLEMIALAKETGTWDALNHVEALIVPEDFQKLLQKNKRAKTNWEKFPPSAKRGILDWLHSAKRPETRKKRLAETIKLAAQNKRANQYQSTAVKERPGK